LVAYRGAGQSIPAFARQGRPPRPPRGKATAAQESHDSGRSFALLEVRASDATADPSVQSLQTLFHPGVPEVVEPTPERRVHFLDHPLQADPTAPLGEAS